MTAAWLLPVVAPIVAAASGGVVASVLPNPQHALWTVVVSYILWGCGVPLAMFIMVIYLQRLTIVGLPPREVIVSAFLPLGPLGQGAFGIMQLGTEAMRLFPLTDTLPLAPEAGQLFYAIGLLLALVMWGFGLVWLFFALATISRQRFPFNIGWWGFTFPLGVFTLSTNQIAKELPSELFKVLGTIFSVAVTMLWLLVTVRTFVKSMSGELFHAPCLKDWEAAKSAKHESAKEKV
jgi:tellurite resistance protein TehA-like permease